MADIVGEPLDKYIQTQITKRQQYHGSGINSHSRTPEQIAYLNSKTAWVKMASATKITKERLGNEKPKMREGFAWDKLAKDYVLFGGVSHLEGTHLKPYTQILGSPTANGWNDGMYDISAQNAQTREFGLLPMPGIESVDIKCLNRGSTKKATVKIKCFSPEQFQILDLLYLRIGYTMFIEWGWAPYIKNSGGLESDYYSLIEDPDGFFSSKWKESSYLDFLNKINGYKRAKDGNYDGLLCRVTNFSWTISQTGTYDIELSLISLGDVVESLKMNISPSYKMSKFLRAAYPLFSDSEATSEETDSITPAPFDNMISAYLFFQKLYLNDNINNSGVDITNTTTQEVYSTINGIPLPLGGVFVQPVENLQLDPIYITDKLFSSRSECEDFLDTHYDGWRSWNNSRNDFHTSLTNVYYIENVAFSDEVKLNIKYFPEIQTANSDQSKKDVIYLNYNNGEDEDINDSGFYMRFGHLLDYIRTNVISKIETNNTPILQIDSETWSNVMFTMPYQVSLDPRVCLVNGGELVSKKSYWPTLSPFKNLNKGYAWHMNIYISHNQILNSLQNNVDDKGNISLFSFLSDICTALNKALGGINNLEPVIDESTNTLRIVDGSYSKPDKSDYKIELYGYNGNESNFVRNFSIKTEITNDFATMATVGSTAGGYVKGTENTMFSKWNDGLIDTFKPKLTPANPESSGLQDDSRDEPNAMYYKNFWTQLYNAFGYVNKDIESYNPITTSGDTLALNDEIIDQNVSVVTEFYKYCQSRLQDKSNKKYSSPTNGFIPISLNLTMDGISGIKIYNEIKVDTRFLPQNYPDSLRFIVKGVNHKIDNNDWETSIETVVIANSGLTD